MCGSAREDLAVFGNADLDVRDRPAHGSEPGAARPVDGNDRRRLGQAVALVDDDARAEVELREIAGERRRAREGEAEAGAEHAADLGEDQLVRELRLPREGRRDFFPALLVAHPSFPNAHRQGELPLRLLPSSIDPDSPLLSRRRGNEREAWGATSMKCLKLFEPDARTR